MQNPETTSSRLVDVLTDVSIREGGQQTLDLRNAAVAVKLELLKLIIRTGIRRIELTAFAPGAWFADAHELAKGAAAVASRDIVLRALYFNTAGLEDLLGHPRLLREGIFHTAATSRYREKNYRQRSPGHAVEKMSRLIAAFQKNSLRFDTLLLSTAWGEPDEALTVPQELAYLERLLETAAKQGLPVASLTLADTVGNATAEAIADLVGAVKAAWPQINVSAHLHPRLGSAEECIQAGLDSGVDHWEAAWGGLGGSPYAAEPGGNLDIRTLADVYQKRGLDSGLNPEAVCDVIDFIRAHTRRIVPDC